MECYFRSAKIRQFIFIAKLLFNKVEKKAFASSIYVLIGRDGVGYPWPLETICVTPTRFFKDVSHYAFAHCALSPITFKNTRVPYFFAQMCTSYVKNG